MKYKLKGNLDFNIVKQICETRGVDFNNLQEFINPKDWVRTNPEMYRNMKEVAMTIIEATSDNKRIGLLIDSDCDGYCSSAMLVNYLKDVMGYANVRLYLHENKEHGLTPFIMNQVKHLLPDLLIIPDASSSDYKQHKELYELGVEVVIIDHHEAENYSENALVVNNQLQENSNKTLSAGGMVLKLLEEIDYLTGKDCAKNYYDLASVALVGDCMLMNNVETRYYVQQGLMNINNKLIEALLGFDGKRDYETISFDIAPTINAFIRVGTLSEKKDLFLALIGVEDNREITIRGQGSYSLELPDYISKMASRIKSRQTREITKALEHKDTEIICDLPMTICILSDDANKNLTGLIGNRLTEIHKKPAIVIKKIKEGFYSGSGRTTDTFDLFKLFLKETNLFAFCEGHQQAFGCGIEKEKLEILKEEYRGKTLSSDFDSYLVDKAYIDNVSAFDIMAIDELSKYWSRGFDKPLFYIKLTNLDANNVEIIGQKRNTIRIKDRNITYLKFKCTEEEIAKIEDVNINEVELVGHFYVNEYYDNLYPQVFIENLEFKGEKKELTPNNPFCFNNIVWK